MQSFWALYDPFHVLWALFGQPPNRKSTQILVITQMVDTNFAYLCRVCRFPKSLGKKSYMKFLPDST